LRRVAIEGIKEISSRSTPRMRRSGLLDAFQQPRGLTSSSTTTLASPTTRLSDRLRRPALGSTRDSRGRRRRCRRSP